MTLKAIHDNMGTSSYFSTSISFFQQLSSYIKFKLQFIEYIFPVGDLTWMRPSSQNLTNLPQCRPYNFARWDLLDTGGFPRGPEVSRFRSMEHMKLMEKSLVM